MTKNKKGGDKILSIYWFVILFLVAIAIVYMTISFYGNPYDVRELEAHALTNRIADCLSEAGHLTEGILEDVTFKNNFLENCNLNFNTEETFDELQYYAGIEISQGGNSVFEVREGNLNLVTSCGVEADVEEERLAKCVEREFYSLDAGGNVHLIKILSIVRKTEKNIKI